VEIKNQKMSKRNRLRNVKNAFGANTQPTTFGAPGSVAVRQGGGSIDPQRNLTNRIAPVQLQRLRHDVAMWREAVVEAENAWYPHRVKMQRLYIDTILNGHVYSLMERRKDLTLLRDYRFIDIEENENKELKDLFNAEWFDLLVGYILDALFFGYSLVSLGDIDNDTFTNTSLIRRWNVSPDRLNVPEFIYSLSGSKFMEEPYKDWHLWVSTPSENGVGTCGYGLFYKIALYEIFLRNTLGYNGDYVELFAMPYRVGKTTKTEEAERAELEAAIQNMGSAGWALIDPMDEIEFLEIGSGGSGFAAYESLEERCEKKVSKIILGHEDAVSSTPGKLGSGQGEDNPVSSALTDKQVKDGKFVERVINGQLLPKMRNLGFNIPENFKFEYKNDSEKEAFRAKEDASNKLTAEIAQTMKNAGLKMDAKYFEERTGIKTTEMEEIEIESEEDKAGVENVKNQLLNLYK
jgi:phage gp29-like protein